jgi:hypothetical protein
VIGGIEMKLIRKAADAIYRNNFGAFTYGAFEVVNPGQKTHSQLAYRVHLSSIGKNGNRPKCKSPCHQPPASQFEISNRIGLPAGLVVGPQSQFTHHVRELR